MPSKLKPTSVIKARLGLTPNGKVQRKFQNSCYRHMEKYVPKREGGLRREVDLSDPTMIIYEQKYAHYMYVGKKYVMDNGKSAFYSPSYGYWSKKPKHLTNEDLVYHTPGTGPYWDKRMVSAEMKQVVKEVQEIING